MFADVLNDLVMSVELLAPALPRHLVLPLLCLTGLGRSLVGVAGGATKAAVAQHQARRNNMADLAAKDGSQETLVNLLGLCVNLVVLPLVTGTQYLPFIIFILLATLHVYCNYRAVSCLVIKTLNTARLHILLDRLAVATQGEVSTPHQVNRMEPVMRPFRNNVNIQLGVSLSTVEKEDVERVKSCIAGEDPYCILHKQSGQYVLISETATPRNIYQAYVKCYLYEKNIRASVPDILKDMETKGWDLSSLALVSKGYLLKLDR